jgi:hypothetical protein
MVTTIYTIDSVVNCTTTSYAVRFYGGVSNITLDCLLVGDCPSDYFYVSLSGVDFPLCGTEETHCLSLVFIFLSLSEYFSFIFFFLFFFSVILIGICTWTK